MEPGLADPGRSGRWNLVRGVAFAGLSAAPPILAAKYMPEGDFLPWVVGFSLLPWLLLSQSGLQPAVLALVGGTEFDPWRRDANFIGRTALKISGLQYVALSAMVVAILVLLTKAALLPDSLQALVKRPPLSVLLLLTGLLHAFSSVGNAIMIAMGNAREMASLTALGASVFMIGAALQVGTWGHLTGNGLTGALCLGMAIPAIGVLRYNARRRSAMPSVHDEMPEDYPKVRGQFYRFMAAQSVWVFPGVLVSGLDNMLVAEFQPYAARVYSVSLALLGLAAAAVGALASPYISHFSGLAVRQVHGGRGFTSWSDVEGSANQLSRISALVSVAGFLAPLLILLVWRGVAGQSASAIAAIPLLAAGLCIRMLTVPMSILVISVKRQRALFPSAIGEAIVNASASLFLGYSFGAIGVAGGTLLGSVAAVAFHGWAALHLLRRVPIGRLWWVRNVLMPAACLASAGIAITLFILWEY